MIARDVMTTAVVSVRPDTPTQKVAGLLRDKGISAVPVVDSSGAPIGMVSEGDLIGRDESDREARRDWWLSLLAEGEALSPDFLASLRPGKRSARDIMAAPVIAVGEDTDVTEIARLLLAHRIKRVPVVRDGRIVGIVSRADLVRALAAEKPATTAAKEAGRRPGMFAGIDEHFFHRQQAKSERASYRPGSDAATSTTAPTANDFRALVASFEQNEAHQHDEARRTSAEQLRRKVKDLIDHHVSDESWRTTLHEARQAAEHGQKEFMLLRFPSQLASDGGRAVNVAETGWPSTLRGEAAEIYLRWERDLRPHGFGLTASVLEFPGGMPGDIGLFLVWGE